MSLDKTVTYVSGPYPVDFYLVDPSDPIAATYQRIFPRLLQPFAAMPQDLQRHIRYPEDLFLIQAQLYRGSCRS
jgi:uncharacterized protein